MIESHASFRDRRRFNGLDGLRCFAILAVIWHHAPHPAFLPMMSRGFLGVDLFFVLSGFLIVTLLIRERARSGRISLKAFWMRRILRLVPAYYALLIALVAVYLVLKPGEAETANLISGLPVYALYFSNWFNPGGPNLGPTWSLATEEQFYLVWPLIEAFAAPVIALWTWAFALAVNQLINFGVLDGALASVLGVASTEHPEILDTTFTPILLGVGLAHLLDNEKGWRFARRIAGFRYAPAAFAILLLVLVNIPASDLSGLPRLAIHLTMALFLASILLSPEGAAARFLDARPIVFVGAISYGMYLYHLFCMHAATAVAASLSLPEFPTVFVLTLMLTVAVAAASYFVFERRFLNLRGRFRP